MDNQPKGDNTPTSPQECARWCFPGPPPRPPSPDSDRGSDDQVKTSLQWFNMDQDHLDSLDFEKDLAHITCSCGHGYFKPDKTWVSGADVRAGLASSKPREWPQLGGKNTEEN
ncbi:hypothetical protein B7463_g9120, partial [Scytalidium lignicola]